MGSYPTPEGKVLSSLVWNHMIDNFGTGKDDSLFEDMVQCLANSDETAISIRKENMKAYISVRDGLKDYINGYSSVELITTGTVAGEASKQSVNIVADYDDLESESNVKLYGYLDLNSDELFNVYSFPNIFFTGEPTTGPGDPMEGLDQLFDTIVSWLAFPMTDVKSTGMGSGLLVIGNGKIKFGANEEITSDDKKAEIFAEYESKLKIVMDEVTAYFEENGKPMDGVFNKYWDIIGSGIVDYLNTNEVVSEDTGNMSLHYVDDADLPMIEDGTYKGASQGVCVFSSTPVTKVVLAIDPLPLGLNINIKLPDLPCVKVTIVDKFGVEKEICAKINLGIIFGAIGDIITNITTAIKDAIASVAEFIEGILTRIGEAIEKIAETIAWVIAELTKQIELIIQAIKDAINKVLEAVSKQIARTATKLLRSTVWAGIISGAQETFAYAVMKGYYLAKTIANWIKSIAEFIEKIFGEILKILQKIRDLIVYVFETVAKMIKKLTNIIAEWFNDLIDNIGDHESCDIIKTTLEIIVNAPTPPVSEDDTEPDQEEQDDDRECANPDYDPDDENSSPCMVCLDADSEPCLYDEEGVDQSGLIPSPSGKVPSDDIDEENDVDFLGSIIPLKIP